MPLEDGDIEKAKFVCMSNLLSSMKLICQNLDSLNISYKSENKVKYISNNSKIHTIFFLKKNGT